MGKISYYGKLLTYTKLPLLKFQDYFNFEKFKVYKKTKYFIFKKITCL